MSNCLFCRIISGEIPCEPVYEDGDFVVFKDKFPKAPIHVLVVPRMHIASLNALEATHEGLMGRLMVGLPLVAKKVGLATGFRTIINTEKAGGQEIFDLHAHILGGAQGHLPGF